MKKLLWNNYIARPLLVIGYFFGNYLSYKTSTITAMNSVGLNATAFNVIFMMLAVSVIYACIFELLIRAAYGFLQNYSSYALSCNKETFARTLRFWKLLLLCALAVLNLVMVYYPLSIMLLNGVGTMVVSLIFYSLFYLDLEKNNHVVPLLRHRLIKILGLVVIIYFGYTACVSLLM